MTFKTPPPRSRRDFEIAIICALPLEANAVIYTFDIDWEDEGKIFGKEEDDPNSYTTGVIGKYNVVVAHMPNMGTVSAAIVAANLRISFKNIKLALVVGICGAMPYVPDRDGEKEDVFLGDVIVSQSIIEYDFGRQQPDAFRVKDTLKDCLGRPPIEIGSLLAKFQTEYHLQRLNQTTNLFLADLQTKLKKSYYPGLEARRADILFDSPSLHKHHNSTACDICQDETNTTICKTAREMNCYELGCYEYGTVHRIRRAPTRDSTIINDAEPRTSVHMGTIGSANYVMRSGRHRDEISRKYGIIAFEMEGAAVWECFPSIIIKGVSDYADSHKDKSWQRYAAAAAASCTKAFLKSWETQNEPIQQVEIRLPQPSLMNMILLQLKQNGEHNSQLQDLIAPLLANTNATRQNHNKNSGRTRLLLPRISYEDISTPTSKSNCLSLSTPSHRVDSIAVKSPSEWKLQRKVAGATQRYRRANQSEWQQNIEACLLLISAATGIASPSVRAAVERLLVLAKEDPILPFFFLAVAFCFCTGFYHLPLQLSLLVGDRISFEDALGDEFRIPYNQCNHFEIFQGFLQVHFKNRPGRQHVRRGHYLITLGASRSHIIDSNNWSELVKPRSRVTMFVVMSTTSNICIKCQGAFRAANYPLVLCENCGEQYIIDENPFRAKRRFSRRIEELEDDTLSSDEIDDDNSNSASEEPNLPSMASSTRNASRRRASNASQDIGIFKHLALSQPPAKSREASNIHKVAPAEESDIVENQPSKDSYSETEKITDSFINSLRRSRRTSKHDSNLPPHQFAVEDSSNSAQDIRGLKFPRYDPTNLYSSITPTDSNTFDNDESNLELPVSGNFSSHSKIAASLRNLAVDFAEEDYFNTTDPDEDEDDENDDDDDNDEDDEDDEDVPGPTVAQETRPFRIDSRLNDPPSNNPTASISNSSIGESNFSSNLQDELQRSMAGSQAALSAALAQGEADRQASREMALDAKKSTLQDAMNRVVINGGNSFKAAAGA